jgi:c-di-GMP-binding flagellar brake protein YcgR
VQLYFAIILCGAFSVAKHLLQQLTSHSRRLTSRVEAPQDVWVYWNCGERDDIARVRDLSMGGLFIETPKPKDVGVTTKLHFLVQEGQIRADAVVRHLAEGRGLGLKFTAVSEEDRPHLSALMTRLRSST